MIALSEGAIVRLNIFSILLILFFFLLPTKISFEGFRNDEVLKKLSVVVEKIRELLKESRISL